MQREESEGYLANWVARLFWQGMDRAISRHGLTPAYVPVLFALSDGAAMTQTQLAAYAAIEQPTMAATLGRMDRDGLLARTPDPADRRKTLISLSARGRDKVAVVGEAVTRINGRAVEGFSEAERKAHRAHMLQIVRNLEAVLAEDDPR